LESSLVQNDSLSPIIKSTLFTAIKSKEMQSIINHVPLAASDGINDLFY